VDDYGSRSTKDVAYFDEHVAVSFSKIS